MLDGVDPLRLSNPNRAPNAAPCFRLSARPKAVCKPHIGLCALRGPRRFGLKRLSVPVRPRQDIVT